jgi:hypothetical protein
VVNPDLFSDERDQRRHWQHFADYRSGDATVSYRAARRSRNEYVCSHVYECGGAFPFLRNQNIDRRRLPFLIALTLAGSIIGAFLLLLIPTRSVPIIVSAAMIGVAVFSFFYRKMKMETANVAVARSVGAEVSGYAFTFLLAWISMAKS